MPAHSLPPGLVETIRNVRSVGVITGAGMSAESGVQTYRGKGGIYDDPIEGDRTVEALSAATLRADPDRSWRTIARLAEQACDARPNPGHVALVAIEQAVESFVLLTQNVDGLHRAAGNENVIEIHGTIFDTTCMRCGDSRQFERTRYLGLREAPKCGECDGTLRPDVVLFGETLPTEASRQMQASFDATLPDLILGVGTSALFPYIVAPILRAQAGGQVTVEVNPEETDLTSQYDHVLRGAAGELLPQIATVLVSGGDSAM